MSAPFPRVDVSAWEVDEFGEPGGDTGKDWLFDPATHERWLFKSVTVKEVPLKSGIGGTRSYRRGEDWAEKICAQLAHLVGLPAAQVELAVKEGVDGSMSRSIRPNDWELHGGSARLAEIDPAYVAWSETNKVKNRIGHNLDNIETVLRDVAPPMGCSEFTAMEVFSGYLLFDAWVANTDRHDHNWAILKSDRGEYVLSPSFDHGSALGSGMEAVRHGSTNTGQWVRNGKAHRFQDGADRDLLDLAWDALGRIRPEIRAHWVTAVTTVNADTWRHLIDRTAILSDDTSTFVNEVLKENQERIAHEYQRHADS